MISIGNGVGSYEGEVVEQTRAVDSSIEDYIRDNIPQADILTKKFNVRKGNATGINQYLRFY